MICEPYASCASLCRRNNWSIDRAVKFWCMAATALKEAIEKYDGTRLIFFTYHELCQDPKGVSERILKFLPPLQSLDYKKEFTLRSLEGRKTRPITDLTPLKRKELSKTDKDLIRKYLEDQLSLLTFFSFSVECPLDE